MPGTGRSWACPNRPPHLALPKASLPIFPYSRQGGKLPPSPRPAGLRQPSRDVIVVLASVGAEKRMLGEQHCSQESQTAAPDTEGSHAQTQPGEGLRNLGSSKVVGAFWHKEGSPQKLACGPG